MHEDPSLNIEKQRHEAANKLREADYADPARKAVVDYVTTLKEVTYNRLYRDKDYDNAYFAFVDTLQETARLKHYFTGSTPPFYAVDFDAEGYSVVDKIEEFMKAHGLS